VSGTLIFIVAVLLAIGCVAPDTVTCTKPFCVRPSWVNCSARPYRAAISEDADHQGRFRFWILDFGFWIGPRERVRVAGDNAFWIIDFGFWIGLRGA